VPRKIRTGWVGCGVVATRDIFPGLLLPKAQEKLELVAVCDVVEERAREAAERFGAAQAYTDYRDMLAQEDLDVVGILTPIRYHFPIAMAAVEAGKHVYVQKTMTDTVDEANRLVEAVRNKGVKLLASPGQQIHPNHGGALADVKQAIASGKLGKICWGRVTASHRHEVEAARMDEGLMDVDPTWYYMPGGGPLKDRTVYETHSLTWLLGPVKRVSAFSGIVEPVRYWKGKRIDVQMDDSTLILLDFGDNVFFTLTSTFVRGNSNLPEIEIYGTKGTALIASFRSGSLQGMYELWLDPNQTSMSVGTELAQVGITDDQLDTISGGHILCDILHLVDCVREDREPVVTPEHSRHVIEIFEKAYESARVGRALDLVTTFTPQG
jgi:predicted dehydrogenase